MNTGIIISGHGHFASGIASSLDLIMGIPENLVIIDFPDGDNIDHLQLEFDSAVKSFKDEEIIIFVDIFSGSPFNVAMRLAMQNPHIHLYYGTNLGMLMETLTKIKFSDNLKEVLDEIVKIGKDQVGHFNPESVNSDDSNDEDDDL